MSGTAAKQSSGTSEALTLTTERRCPGDENWLGKALDDIISPIRAIIVTRQKSGIFNLKTAALIWKAPTPRLVLEIVCCASLAMIVDAYAEILAHIDMTSDEADQHIIQSRRFLADWIAVGAGSEIEEVLQMVSQEILILEALAEEHPGKVGKIIALATEWIQFQDGLKKQLN
ncbi:MAG: hypothetical protein KME20_27280 [Kaiparowitsia implicata GSE-PSE-MK54-09C]|nr:hypothetical protein [Kaiparowitsia implicata GSE-PSE-MK54-09C]